MNLSIKIEWRPSSSRISWPFSVRRPIVEASEVLTHLTILNTALPMTTRE